MLLRRAGCGTLFVVPDLTIRSYVAADEAAVVRLWRRCELTTPANHPEHDIHLKVACQPDLLLVASLGDEVVGSVMAGWEGHRGWINYLAVAPPVQRRGIGRALMAAAEARLRALGCGKINLQVRGSNANVVAFYERVGFAVEDRISLGKRLP